jgi:hypothetical protein
MRNKIYPWIILWAVLSTVILYAPSDLYKYALPVLREKARTAVFRLKWELDKVRYGPRGCAGYALAPSQRDSGLVPMWHYGAFPHTRSPWNFGTSPTLNLAKRHAFNAVTAAPELHLARSHKINLYAR